MLGAGIWMRINQEGSAMMLEADKYAIMHRVGIHARDLRLLDPLLSYPSTILGRERAIVLNLEHVKAIITADEVLLRNSTHADVIPFVEELKRRLAMGGALAEVYGGSDAEIDGGDFNQLQKPQASPPQGGRRSRGGRDAGGGALNEELSDREEEVPAFEFQALEVVLEAVCSFLDARTIELETSAQPALDELTAKISSLNLERVRKLKNVMTRLTARVQKVADELEQLLDDDDDMAEMFLTRKLLQPPSGGSSHSGSPPGSAGGTTVGTPGGGPSFPSQHSHYSHGLSRVSTIASTYLADSGDVEELEQLLEAYFTQVNGTLNKLNTLREYIDDTEDYINIQLDNHRNQLIQLELMLNLALVVVTIYAVVVGIFGMNIPYKWNNDNRAFGRVVIVTSAMCLSIFSLLILYARHRRIIA